MVRGNGGEEYQDTIYGSVHLTPLQVELSRSAEVSHTERVSQLGLAHRVYSGAKHTRFAHNLGASILAGKYAEALGLGTVETNTLVAALLLHDIGHTPFSHSAGAYFERRWGYGQEQLASEKILGNGEVHPILLHHGINPQIVAGLIFDRDFGLKGDQRQRCLKQLTSGSMDLDRLDFLMRDAAHTTLFRHLDFQKLMNFALHLDDPEQGYIVAYEESAFPYIKAFLNAYSTMYETVYYSPDTKAYEAFLDKALNIMHEYLFERFRAYRQDPSQIDERDLETALQQIPVDKSEYLVAREIVGLLEDPKKKPVIEAADACFLRTRDPESKEKLAKIYERFPFSGQGTDPLETLLLSELGAREGEVLVIRNITDPQEYAPRKPTDIFIRLVNSGFSPGRIIPADAYLGDETSLRKELRHYQSFRILTIREAYKQKIQRIMQQMTGI